MAGVNYSHLDEKNFWMLHKYLWILYFGYYLFAINICCLAMWNICLNQKFLKSNKFWHCNRVPYLSEWGSVPPKGLHGVPALLLRLSQLSSHVFLVYNDGNKYIWHKIMKMKCCLIFYWGWYSLTIRVECRGGSKEGGIWRTPLPSRNQIFLKFIEFFSEKNLKFDGGTAPFQGLVPLPRRNPVFASRFNGLTFPKKGFW